MKYFVIILAVLLTGCAKYFEEPMPLDSDATVGSIQVYVNMLARDAYYKPKRPHFNGTCLETAERKYELLEDQGLKSKIVIIRLHKDVEEQRNAASPLHAVLVYDGEVYDNGFISEIPFDLEDLDRYGVQVPDVWSDYREVK